MSEEKNITEESIKVAIKDLNAHLKSKEKEEISIEGIEGVEAQIQVFLVPVFEEIENGTAAELPEKVIELYNQIAEDEEEPGEPEEGCFFLPLESFTEKKPKKKPRKEIEKDAYGVSMNSGAHKLNLMLEKGASIADMIDGVGTTRSRVQSHMASLKTKGFFINNIDGVFTVMSEEPPERLKKEKVDGAKEGEKTEKKKAPAKKSSSKKSSSKKSSSKKSSSKKGK
jgi:hypothetical protein